MSPKIFKPDKYLHKNDEMCIFFQVNANGLNAIYAQINNCCATKKLKYTYFNISFTLFRSFSHPPEACFSMPHATINTVLLHNQILIVTQ